MHLVCTREYEILQLTVVYTRRWKGTLSTERRNETRKRLFEWRMLDDSHEIPSRKNFILFASGEVKRSIKARAKHTTERFHKIHASHALSWCLLTFTRTHNTHRATAHTYYVQSTASSFIHFTIFFSLLPLGLTTSLHSSSSSSSFCILHFGILILKFFPLIKITQQYNRIDMGKFQVENIDWLLMTGRHAECIQWKMERHEEKKNCAKYEYQSRKCCYYYECKQGKSYKCNR